jgi:hypothetical protein
MAEWTTDAVAARFAEAAETARRLPPGRGQGYFNRDFPIELNFYWKPLGNHHDFIEV